MVDSTSQMSAADRLAVLQAQLNRMRNNGPSQTSAPPISPTKPSPASVAPTPSYLGGDDPRTNIVALQQRLKTLKEARAGMALSSPSTSLQTSSVSNTSHGNNPLSPAPDAFPPSPAYNKQTHVSSTLSSTPIPPQASPPGPYSTPSKPVPMTSFANPAYPPTTPTAVSPAAARIAQLQAQLAALKSGTHQPDAEDARRIEEARRADEARRMEEARRAEEARRSEEARVKELEAELMMARELQRQREMEQQRQRALAEQERRERERQAELERQRQEQIRLEQEREARMRWELELRSRIEILTGQLSSAREAEDRAIAELLRSNKEKVTAAFQAEQALLAQIDELQKQLDPSWVRPAKSSQEQNRETNRQILLGNAYSPASSAAAADLEKLEHENTQLSLHLEEMKGASLRMERWVHRLLEEAKQVDAVKGLELSIEFESEGGGVPELQSTPFEPAVLAPASATVASSDLFPAPAVFDSGVQPEETKSKPPSGILKSAANSSKIKRSSSFLVRQVDALTRPRSNSEVSLSSLGDLDVDDEESLMGTDEVSSVVQEKILEMRAGSTMIRHDNKAFGRPAKRGVFYRDSDPTVYPGGTLQLSMPGQPLDSRAEIHPLHEITDIYLGKQTPSFRRHVSKKVDEALCFSMKDINGKMLNLECPSATSRDAWVIGIIGITRANLQDVILHRVPLFVNTPLHVERPPPIKMQIAVRVRNIPNLPPKRFHRKKALVRVFEKDLTTGKYHYLDQTEQARLPGRSPGFDKILNVDYCPGEEQIICFSLSYHPSSTKLEYKYRIGYAEVRLAQLVQAPGIDYDYRLKNAQKKSYSQLLDKATTVISVRGIRKPDEEAVQKYLQSAERMELARSDRSSVSSTSTTYSQLYRRDSKTVTFSDVNQTKVMSDHDETSPPESPLSKASSLTNSALNNTFFDLNAASMSPGSNTSTAAFSGYAQSPTGAAIVPPYNTVSSYTPPAGAQEPHQTTLNGLGASNDVSAPQDASGELHLPDHVKQLERMMAYGRSLTFYFSDKPSEKLSLFYKQGAEGPSLFWCHSGARDCWPDKCLPLNQITDLFLGKQTDAFNFGPSCHEAMEECCFSIGSMGKTLELEAKSEKQRDSWAFGILGITRAMGRHVNLHD